jgi:hypothetical protein
LCAARQESSGPVPSAPVVQTRRLTRDSSESELKQEILVFDKEFLFPEIDDTAHTEGVTGRNSAYYLLEVANHLSNRLFEREEQNGLISPSVDQSLECEECTAFPSHGGISVRLMLGSDLMP